MKGLGLGQYADVFAQNHIDETLLPELTEADLADLGLSLGHRRKLLKAIRARAAPTRARPPTQNEQEPTDLKAPTENDLEPQAERRQLTIMFCNLIDADRRSEQIDPEDLQALMRAYQQTGTTVIDTYDGHIAQYLADGFMAYFGWPTAHEDDAERAIRAALDIVEAIKAVDAKPSLHVHIGVATGPVVVGDLALDQAVHAARITPAHAVGATPNLAARLQGLARADEIVIAPSTRQLVGAAFDLEDHGEHALKGIVEPVRAWRIRGLADIAGRFEARTQQLTPLVGRQSEIALLLERWETAKTGEGQVVLLSGEPGIGKSRTTQALRHHVADQAHIRLRYQCSPYYSNSALHPFINQFEAAARFTPKDTAAQKLDKVEKVLRQATNDIADIAPLFAAMLSLDTANRYPPLNMTPQQQKDQTLLALTNQIEALSEKLPVLVIFEDAHWVDPTTQEVLERLIGCITNRRVLLVITHRPEYDANALHAGHVTSLSLARLDRRHAASIATAVARDTRLADRVLEQIVAGTDGVPLFIEELTKTVIETAAEKSSTQNQPTAGSPLPLSIPTSLQDSLTARLDRLGPVKEVAQLAATLGRSFRHDLLLALAPDRREELESAIRALEAAELIFRRGAAPNMSYQFKHALVQEAAYNSLLISRRQRHHAHIARTLEARFPERAETEPEYLAHHYTEAGLAEQAIDHWLKAGRRSTENVANVEAVAQLHRGLELVEALPKDGQLQQRKELDLQVALGPSLISTQGYLAQETEVCYARALSLCHALGDPPELFPILYGLWVIRFIRAELDKARTLGEDFLRRAKASKDRVALISAHRTLGSAQLVLGNLSDARKDLERTIELYDPQRDRWLGHVYSLDPYVTAKAYLSWTYWCLGYPGRALATIRDARAFGEDISQPYSLALELMFEAMIQFLCGEWTQAQHEAETCLAVASEHGFPYWLAFTHIVRGWALIKGGEIDTGMTEVLRGISHYRQIDGGLYWPMAHCALADGYTAQGQIESALAALEDATQAAANTSEHWMAPETVRLKGEILAESDMAAAEACFAAAILRAEAQDAKSWQLRAATSQARLWRRHGMADKARDLLTPIYSWFSEGLETADLRAAKALLAP